MAIYAIGDVQGCFEQLQALLDKLQFNSDSDTLWFAGDIVNRGPNSLDTLRFIRSLGNKAITVLGNHDLHLLAVANGRGKQGKKDTIKDILDAPDRDELLDWLLHRPLMHYNKKLNVSLTHAGIYPKWNIREALECRDAVLLAPLARGDRRPQGGATSAGAANAACRGSPARRCAPGSAARRVRSADP